MAEDKFVTAMQTLMVEGGFTVYRAFAVDPNDPDAVVETLMLSRSVDMLEKAALDVLTQSGLGQVVDCKSPSIN